MNGWKCRRGGMECTEWTPLLPADQMRYRSRHGTLMARVRVDRREQALLELFREHAEDYEIESLPVGDVQVDYEHGGRGWLCERKTVLDLAQSIKDGRWRDQRSRMFESGKRPVFILEGDMLEVGYKLSEQLRKSVFTAWLNISSGGCALTFRTFEVRETFEVLTGLVLRLEHPPPSCPFGQGDALSAPKLQSKRCKNAEPRTIFVRQLMCIPSVSENVATALAAHFDNLVALQQALKDLKRFPTIELGKHKLGKARLEHLVTHLLATPDPHEAEEPEQKS